MFFESPKLTIDFFSIRDRQISIKDGQIAAMSKKRGAAGANNSHKKELEKVLKEKDFFLKRYVVIETLSEPS